MTRLPLALDELLRVLVLNVVGVGDVIADEDRVDEDEVVRVVVVVVVLEKLL